MKSIEWLSGRVRLIDQTRLPGVEAYVETSDYRELAEAIRTLKVRGAPLIGITAAYGLALAARPDGRPSGREAPDGAAAANPAFDVTPARHVTAIVTEHGVARAPYVDSLTALTEAEARTRG